MTLVVLALDALDRGLIEYFDADAFRLESAGGLETFAKTQDDPYTPEVWATVATGLPPEDHGVTGAGTSEWTNPLLSTLSRFTGQLDESTRGSLGKFVRHNTGEREHIGETSRETVFDLDGAVVHNWPGVYEGRYLQRAWDLMNAVADGAPRHEFERDLFGLCAQQFGWVREMLRHPVSVAGVHVHTLDAAGHAYADDEAVLRQMYERVGEFVVDVERALGEEDQLLLLSDHGMRTAFYPEDEGTNPGSHSWRAYASTTADTPPESVYDVREWIETRIAASTIEQETVELPVERLRELGYLE